MPFKVSLLLLGTRERERERRSGRMPVRVTVRKERSISNGGTMLFIRVLIERANVDVVLRQLNE